MNKKNWNALMLWNFVNDFIKGDESDPQKILENCVNRIIKSYPVTLVSPEAKTQVMKAKAAIGFYVKDLMLGVCLMGCKEYYNKNDTNDLFSSVPRINNIVTYHPVTEELPWLQSSVSTVKIATDIVLHYTEDFGLGILSLIDNHYTNNKYPLGAFLLISVLTGHSGGLMISGNA